MGIILVAFLPATAAEVAGVKSTSTWQRINSSARAGSRSSLPSAYLYSKAMFSPFDITESTKLSLEHVARGS